MVDSIRIKEIHACLGARDFAFSDPTVGTPIYMNLGRKIDLLCKAFGLMFDSDGNIIPTRPPVHIEQGKDIPVGWVFEQFDRNTGNMADGQRGGETTQERLGIVYQVRSNQIVTDSIGGVREIKKGGYILCENWFQYFEAMLNDLDRALDWQELGAGFMSFNGKTFVNEGLFDILQEMHIVSADTNQTTEQTRISSLVTQQLTKEVLKAIGLPTIVKKINFKLQNEDTTGNTTPTVAEIPYNGVADQAPTVASLLLYLLENIAIGNIGKLQLATDSIINQKPPTELNKEIIPKNTIKDYVKNLAKSVQDWVKNAIITNRSSG